MLDSENPRLPGRRRRHVAALLAGVAMLSSACGATPSASERVLASAEPTLAADALPFPAPTSSADPAPTRSPVATTAPIEVEPAQAELPAPTALALPSAIPEPANTPTATPSPTETPQPTATPQPATPTPDRDPEPTATATPEPTTTPEVTPTPEGPPTPTPSPTPGGPDGIAVSCAANPASKTLRVEEFITFEALQDPVSPGLSFTFNHGDGTVNFGESSIVRYAAPGNYVVTLAWSGGEDSGTVPCGVIEVTGVGAGTFQPRDYVGLPESDARGLAATRVLNVRITRRDDEQFPGTADFRQDRINFEIDDGIVTVASLG